MAQGTGLRDRLRQGTTEDQLKAEGYKPNSIYKAKHELRRRGELPSVQNQSPTDTSRQTPGGEGGNREKEGRGGKTIYQTEEGTREEGAELPEEKGRKGAKRLSEDELGDYFTVYIYYQTISNFNYLKREGKIDPETPFEDWIVEATDYAMRYKYHLRPVVEEIKPGGDRDELREKLHGFVRDGKLAPEVYDELSEVIRWLG